MNTNKTTHLEAIGSGDRQEVTNRLNRLTPTLPVPEKCAQGLTKKKTVKEVNNIKDMKVHHEEMVKILNEGFLYYGVPGALAFVAMTAALRSRQRRMSPNLVESVLLSCVQYYGATSLGATIGLALYTPKMNQKILERLPHSDMARQIRMEQSRNQ